MGMGVKKCVEAHGKKSPEAPPSGGTLYFHESMESDMQGEELNSLRQGEA